jgi:GntR family transcriptional regulator, rspAB operon transcriptional repressor
MQERKYSVAPSNTASDARVIAHVPLPDAVHAALRRRILNGDFEAGERLVESRISEEFGVSRTTLRSALRELANENLVEISNRHGCYVARMDLDEIEDTCFARYLLEASVVSENVDWLTPELFDALEDQIENMKLAALSRDMASIVDADTNFHGVIVAAGGRTRVAELWHLMDGQMGSVVRSATDELGIDMNEIAQRHQLIVQALRTKTADIIEGAIKDHYVRVSQLR